MAKLPQYVLDAMARARAPSFDLLPENDYVMQVIESGLENTLYGSALKFTLQVAEGPFRKRRVWVTMYYEHPTAATAERAQREFLALRDAVGVAEDFDDSEQLHNVPFIARVYKRPAAEGFTAKNSADRFRRLPVTASADAEVTAEAQDEPPTGE